MAGMDDLDFEGLIDGVFDAQDDVPDDDDTAKMDAAALFGPKGRKNLKTPVLSGRKMASESSAALPLQDEETVEMLADVDSAQRTQSGFGAVYSKAGLAGRDFDIFKLEELYEDDEIRELAPASRKAAVRAILKSHRVDLQTILDDAVERRDALETHDARMKRGVNSIVARVDEDNAAIQAEIEAFANPRLQKMEANEVHAEQTRRKYRDWVERKQRELSRIVSIVEEWGGDDRLRVTEKVGAVQDNARTVPNEAIPEALSGDDVFDGKSGSAAKIITLDDVSRENARKQSRTVDEPSSSEPTSLGEEWSFSDVDEMKPGSVETEIPSTFHVAKADAERADQTESFSFDADKPVYLPRTALEGIVAAFAVIIWIPAGLLLAAQLTQVVALAAIGIGWGGPLIAAFVVTVGFGLAHKRVRFFSMFLFFSIVALGVAHYDPGNLHQALIKRPIWFADEAGLGEGAEESLARLTTPYGELLEQQLGLDPIVTTPDKAGE